MVSKLNIEKVNHEVNRKLCLYISSGCLIAVMVLQIVGVFMRTLFNRPIWGLLDVCQILLAWLVFAAFAYALINSYHIRATLVVSRLSPRLRSACEIFGSVIGIGFFVVFTYLACSNFWASFLEKETAESEVSTPIWLAKLAIPLSGIMMLIAFIIRLFHTSRPKGEVFFEEEKKIF